jgi:mRNA deadenylase 3'-5' endonuclease subunit Ccr4
MRFRAASYNVLASAYIKPAFYPRVEPALLDPAWRIPALVRHIAGLEADLLGLQEVDAATYAALESGLAPLGFAGHYARETGRKPDGCATFYRRELFVMRAMERLAYADGSGHIALLAELEQSGQCLGLANTHLKWSPPGADHDARQMHELLVALAPRAGDWIICGDFNAKPGSEVLRLLRDAGYRPSHADPTAFTCNPNGEAKTIDYLCHTAAFSASPQPLPPIDDRTPLPSREQPSDHLAVVATFDRLAGWSGIGEKRLS